MNYYFRYFPSNKRLENKLLEKTDGNRELVDQVLFDLKEFLEEDKIIEAKIRNYISRNKCIYYIRGKLWEKLFTKEISEDLLKKLYPEEQQEEVIKREYDKIRGKYPHQKIVEKLLLKGFSY